MKTENQNATPALEKPALSEAEKLTARIKELQARKRDMDRADKARLKALEKNKLLILGRVFLERGAKIPKFHAAVMALLGSTLTDEGERKLFDLPPLTAAPKQATAHDKNTGKPAAQTVPACPKSSNGVPTKPAPTNSENPGNQFAQTATPAGEKLSKGASPNPAQTSPVNMGGQPLRTTNPSESTEGLASKPVASAPTSSVDQLLTKPPPAITENPTNSNPESATAARPE